MTRHARAAALLALTLAAPAVHAQAPRAVTADPGPAHAGATPASMIELQLSSGGERMNGLLYRAAGVGPRPVVVLLHGFPGNERNLDLAQSLRRAGADVLYFDYRGTWGSAGHFSFAGGLDDVAAAVAWIRSPDNVAKFHFDPQRIVLVGHSYGGWLALNSTAHDAGLRCVATIAAWNSGYTGKRLGADPDEAGKRLVYYRGLTDGAGAPVNATAQELMRDLTDHAAAWDYTTLGGELASRTVLLFAGTRDSEYSGVERQADLARAIRAAGGQHVRLVRYEDDHSFGSHRIAIAGELVRWLNGECARHAPAG